MILSQKEEGILVLHDGGGGATDPSVEFYQRHKTELGRIVDVFVDSMSQFSLEIQGFNYKTHEATCMLLSGCCCGYAGTGPNGTLKILKDICYRQNHYFNETSLRTLIMVKRYLHFDFRGNELQVK